MLLNRTSEFTSALTFPSSPHGRRPFMTRAVQRPSRELGLLNTLSIFAHDLRGPLASLSVLLEGIGAQGAKSPDGAISKNAEKAQAIIGALDGLLSSMLSRVRTEGDALAPLSKWVDLDQLLERAAALSLLIAEQRGVRLHLVAEPVELRGDPSMLLQALDNLINNAVKHAPARSTVAISLEESDGHAEIRIADQGPGLEPSDLQKAFRPFTRLSAKAEGQRSSFGLGLWIARLMAERHGGSISARNRTSGRGAVFTIRLPLDAD